MTLNSGPKTNEIQTATTLIKICPTPDGRLRTSSDRALVPSRNAYSFEDIKPFYSRSHERQCNSLKAAVLDDSRVDILQPLS